MSLFLTLNNLTIKIIKIKVYQWHNNYFDIYELIIS